jgi:hypothetical protein
MSRHAVGDFLKDPDPKKVSDPKKVRDTKKIPEASVSKETKKAALAGAKEKAPVTTDSKDKKMVASAGTKNKVTLRSEKRVVDEEKNVVEEESDMDDESESEFSDDSFESVEDKVEEMEMEVVLSKKDKKIAKKMGNKNVEETVTGTPGKRPREVLDKEDSIDSIETSKKAKGLSGQAIKRNERPAQNKPRNPESEFVVYAKSKNPATNLTQLNPGRVQKDIDDAVGRKTVVNKAGNSLRIVCEDEKERVAMIAEKFLGGYEVIYSKPYAVANKEKGLSKQGIIFGVDLEIDAESMVEATGASKARRVVKWYGGKEVKTQQMVLSYEGEVELPNYVCYGWKRYRMSEFIPDPIRCFKCNKFNHRAENCDRKNKCTICAQQHDSRECPQKLVESIKDRETKCPNCSGAHPATYKGCPAFQKAKEIKKVQIVEKLSYADAVNRVREIGQDKKAKVALSSQTETETDRKTEVKVTRAPSETRTPNKRAGKSSTSVNTATQYRSEHANCVTRKNMFDLIVHITLQVKQSKTRSELMEALRDIAAKFVGPVDPTDEANQGGQSESGSRTWD